MRKAYPLVAVSAFVVAAILAALVAVVGARKIEEQSVDLVSFAMQEDGLDWVEVTADGLQVFLAGTAPDEATRFRAIRRVNTVVDPDRVVDEMDVVDPESIVAPEFSIEMLRNGDGVSLIGLVPAGEGRERLTTAVRDFASGLDVANMVETADFPAPSGWHDAVEFGLRALSELPRAKVSVYEGHVVVEAVSNSPAQKAEWEELLEELRPESVALDMDISAPRPVITPFSLRYVQTPEGGRFEACSAETEASRDRIFSAARAAGLTGPETCRIGLGVPTTQWAEAAEIALSSVVRFENAVVTFSDVDITLIAAQGTSSDLFDTVIGELESGLPDVFSLHAVLPDPPPESGETEGPPNFTATRSPEGYVQLRGRLPDDRITEAVDAYATALFGRQNTYLGTRTDEDLPWGWSLRVLAGLEALGQLHNGSLTVLPETVQIRGTSGSEEATSELTQMLSEHLGAAEGFEIEVTYNAALDPATGIPSPQQCLDRINAVLAQNRITFDPGSVEVNATTAEILDELAEILPDCGHAEMEIGGHTDSQGREETNLRISQGRADAILNGLLARRVLTSNLSAQGYGEARPIADNETTEGREANRRIEFVLLTEIEEREVREAAEARAALLADAPRPVMRPDNLVPPEDNSSDADEEEEEE